MFCPMELSGKNAIVTGAAKRIGREIALALAGQGMNIAVHYHNSKKDAHELAEKITAMGRKAVAIKADCAKRKDIYSAVEKAKKEFGVLHLLINNAAIFDPSNFFETDDNEWNKYLDVNLKAPFYFAQKFAENNSAGLAKIINIADTYGVSPAASFIPYGVSKSGVISLTKGLAKALAPKILVNCICPGPILPSAGGTTEQTQRSIDSTLLKRMGAMEDIAKTVLFLAENDYITGQAIFVDGGKSI